MIDERMFNLLRDQLSTAQTEKGALCTQITSLTAEIHMLRDENERYRTEDKASTRELQSPLSSVKAQLEVALQAIEFLNHELTKERDRNANSKRKIYTRTSEQARLLNNRNVDERSLEKDNFDGNSVGKSNDDAPTETPSKGTGKEKRPRGKKNKSEDKFVNETITHKLSDYHTLPEGGRYLIRRGEVEIYFLNIPNVIPHVQYITSMR